MPSSMSRSRLRKRPTLIAQFGAFFLICSKSQDVGSFSGKLLRLYCQNPAMNTAWFVLICVCCLLPNIPRAPVGLEDSANSISAIRPKQSVAAPTGRPSIARGVNPWWPEHISASPNGATENALAATAAPLGLFPFWRPVFQGLTPLAIDGRPVGAAEHEIRPFWGGWSTTVSASATCWIAPLCRLGRVFEAH